MALADIYNYFEDWDADSFTVLGQRGDEPTEADIAAVESRIGFRLPDEFREYSVHPLGGLYMAVREELWPRPKANHVGPYWSFLFGLTVYSFCKEAPEWMQLRVAWERMAAAGYPKLVPFLRIIGSADRYCFTQKGKTVLWCHDSPDEVEEIPETFSEVIMREIHALEERKDRKLRGEDKKRPKA